MSSWSKFCAILLFSTIAILSVVPAAQANEKPYPEPIIRSLVETCVKDQGFFVPFKSTKASKDPEKTLPILIGEYQKVLTNSIAQYKEQSLQQEQVIDAQIQQRLSLLTEMLKDKSKLTKELTIIRSSLSTGLLNGQKLSPEILAFIKKSEQDLAMLEKDPNHIEKMAKTAREQEISKLRQNDRKFITEANLDLGKLTTCGCALEKVQKTYPLDELADRIKLEITGVAGISQDIRSNIEQCKLTSKTSKSQTPQSRTDEFETSNSPRFN